MTDETLRDTQLVLHSNPHYSSLHRILRFLRTSFGFPKLKLFDYIVTDFARTVLSEEVGVGR